MEADSDASVVASDTRLTDAAFAEAWKVVAHDCDRGWGTVQSRCQWLRHRASEEASMHIFMSDTSDPPEGCMILGKGRLMCTETDTNSHRCLFLMIRNALLREG